MTNFMNSNNSIFAKKIHSKVDWLGNTCLHKIFSNYEIDLQLLKGILEVYPLLVSRTNRCGRIPLHYAVDRGRINIAALEMLLEAYPEGILVKDSENMTPYDIVRKWDHDRSVQWLFLQKMPKIDQDQYLKMKYGALGSLAVWAQGSTSRSSSSSKASHQTQNGMKERRDRSNTIDMNEEEDEVREHYERRSLNEEEEHGFDRFEKEFFAMKKAAMAKREEGDYHDEVRMVEVESVSELRGDRKLSTDNQQMMEEGDLKRQKITYTQNVQPFPFNKTQQSTSLQSLSLHIQIQLSSRDDGDLLEGLAPVDI